MKTQKKNNSREVTFVIENWEASWLVKNQPIRCTLHPAPYQIEAAVVQRLH